MNEIIVILTGSLRDMATISRMSFSLGQLLIIGPAVVDELLEFRLESSSFVIVLSLGNMERLGLRQNM